MTDKELSEHQKGIIKRYYGNLEPIMLNKLQQLVTEIYLAGSEKKRKQLWERVRKAMVNLAIPAAIIDHIMEKGSVEILAKHVEDWLKASGK